MGEQSPFNLKNMGFIVIETYGGAEYAIVVTDTNGNNKVFDTRAEADNEVTDYHDGLVVDNRFIG